MHNPGSSVLGVGTLTGLKEELASLIETLAGVNAAIQSNAQDTADAVTGTIEEVDQADAAVADRQRQRAVEVAAAKVQAAADAKAALDELGGADPSLLSPKEHPLAADINAEQQGLLDQYEEKLEELAQRQKALAEEISLEQQALDDQHAAKMEELAARQRALAEEIALEQQGLQDQYSAKVEEEQDRRLAREREIAEEIALEQQALLDQYEARREEIAARQKALAEEITLEQQGLEDEYAAKVAADQERLAARQKALAEEIALEQQGLQDQYAAKQEAIAEREEAASGAALANFGNMVVRIAEAYAIWQAIQVVINAISATINLPFKVFEDGSKYLDEVQSSADRLTGTLAANVKYAEGFKENFVAASQASREAVVALRDIATQTGLSFDHLETTFRSLVTAGAAFHVSNTQEIVTLAQILDITNEQVKGTENLRGLLSDIPKLLNGTLQPGSAFLEVTGLTVAQAKELVAQSQQHYDLLQRLEPIFAPYLTAAQAAELHHKNIVAALDEQINRLEAMVALPVFEKITSFLREVLDWLGAHKQALQQIADLLGQAVEHLIAVGNRLAQSSDSASMLKGFFVDIVISTASWVSYLELAAKTIGDIKTLWADSGGLWSDHVDDPKKAIADVKALEDDFQSFKNIGDQLEEQRQKLTRALNTVTVPCGCPVC